MRQKHSEVHGTFLSTRKSKLSQTGRIDCEYIHTNWFNMSHPLTEIASLALCQREPKVPRKHTTTQPIMPEMRLEPLDVCLTDRRLNQLS